MTKEYFRRYRLLHKDKILESKRVWREKNRDKLAAYSKIYKKTSRGRYINYQSHAKDKGRSFEITFEDFKKIISLPCHYCGFNKAENGIDRKDNNKGYEANNVLPCCFPCNQFKRAQDYGFFIEMCKKIGTYINK